MTDAGVLLIVGGLLVWALIHQRDVLAVVCLAYLEHLLRFILVVTCNVIYFYVILFWVIPFMFQSLFRTHAGHG